MLTIRLQRTGSKNRPEFRVVLAQAHRSASKKFLEVLGHYNPRNKELGIKNKERLEYWVSKNTNLSPTVRNLLIEKKLIEGKKVKAWQPKKKAAPAAEAPPAPAAAATPSDDGASLAPKEREAPAGEAPAEPIPAAPEVPAA